MKKEYSYELKYTDEANNYTVTHKFNADIDADDLTDYLREFLLGCSWSPSQVDAIFKGIDTSEEEVSCSTCGRGGCRYVG